MPYLEYGETAMAPDGRPSMVDLKQNTSILVKINAGGATQYRARTVRASLGCGASEGTALRVGWPTTSSSAGGCASACVHVGGCARGCALAGVHVNGCSHVRTGVRGVWFCASARHACAAGCVFRERPCVCCRRTLMSLSWSSSVCAAGGGWTARRGCGRRGRIRPHG